MILYVYRNIDTGDVVFRSDRIDPNLEPKDLEYLGTTQIPLGSG